MNNRIALRFSMLLIALSTYNASTCLAQQGWGAKVEHLFLAPKLSDNGVQNIFYFGDFPSSFEQSGSIDSQLGYAQRLILGYEGANGGGAQVRWFTFDQDVGYQGVLEEGPDIALSGGLNLDVDAIDTELTQRGRFTVWDWTATAGARYAKLSLRENEINFEDSADIVWFGSTGVQFEGVGPTMSVSGARDLGSSGASLFARARTSLLFGDTDLFSAFRQGGEYTNPDDSVLITELQLGTNYECRLQNFDVLTGIFWEAQKWDSDSDLLGDIGFHGFGLTTGVRY